MALGPVATTLGAVPTVLIVEDDRDIRDALSGVLADQGYAICEAIDGEDALTALKTIEVLPHIVLLDMTMPRMNGQQFLDALTLLPEFDAVPVVVVSAYGGLVLPRARAIMRKPIDVDTLLARVDKICLERVAESDRD